MRSPLFIPLLKYCSNGFLNLTSFVLLVSCLFFSLCLAPKGPLGEVTQKQMITEWYEYEKLKLISRDEIEQQMSNTFFLWDGNSVEKENMLLLSNQIWAKAVWPQDMHYLTYNT